MQGMDVICKCPYCNKYLEMSIPLDLLVYFRLPANSPVIWQELKVTQAMKRE